MEGITKSAGIVPEIQEELLLPKYAVFPEVQKVQIVPFSSVQDAARIDRAERRVKVIKSIRFILVEIKWLLKLNVSSEDFASKC
ncbi:MAG: hypothetical protein Q4E32_10185 [Bacteroidales bacterium]|nr:hypothetical protein [Bacteroidales bacterium]